MIRTSDKIPETAVERAHCLCLAFFRVAIPCSAAMLTVITCVVLSPAAQALKSASNIV